VVGLLAIDNYPIEYIAIAHCRTSAQTAVRSTMAP
jgi:hypothetical protein